MSRTTMLVTALTALLTFVGAPLVGVLTRLLLARYRVLGAHMNASEQAAAARTDKRRALRLELLLLVAVVSLVHASRPSGKLRTHTHYARAAN